MVRESLAREISRDPPRTERIKFHIGGLFELQALLANEPAREVWIASGTKGGKTKGLAAWETKQALTGPGGTYWWIGPFHQSTKNGYKQLALCARPLARDGRATLVAGKKEIRFDNESVIEGRSADNIEGLYGPNIEAVTVDEAHRCRPEVYEAIASVTTPTNAPVRYVMNLDRGRRHWAIQRLLQAKQKCTVPLPYRLDPAIVREIPDADLRARVWDYYPKGVVAWRNPEGTLAVYHFPTRANPFIAPETIEDRRLNLPAAKFEALYWGIIPEDDLGVFREADVRAAAKCQREAGPVKGRAYVVGLDLARKQDWTVAIVLDQTTMTVVDWLRFHESEWSLQVNRVAELSRKWGARILAEANGPGDPIIEALNRKAVHTIPFVTTAQSKPALIEELILTFEQRGIQIPTEELFPQLVGELLVFEAEHQIL